MKYANLFLFVGLAIGVIGCKESETADDAEPVGDGAAVYFAVDGMMCEESCAASVREILAAQPGVWKTDVDFEGKTARCIVDEKQFNPDHVVAELDDKGFTAKLKSD